MKKCISMLLIVSALFCFIRCTGQKNYRDDASTSALAVNAQKKVVLGPDLSFSEKDELSLTVEPFLNEAVEKATECSVIFTGGASFDEFGIFHCADQKDTEETRDLILKYLKNKAEDELYRSYFPGEEYKLDQATCKVFGNYVVFATLTESNRTALFTEIEQLLLVV